jgi:hypothetical protein
MTAHERAERLRWAMGRVIQAQRRCVLTPRDYETCWLTRPDGHWYDWRHLLTRQHAENKGLALRILRALDGVLAAERAEGARPRTQRWYGPAPPEITYRFRAPLTEEESWDY